PAREAAAGEEDVGGTFDLSVDDEPGASPSGRGGPGSGAAKSKPASPRPTKGPTSPRPAGNPASPRPGAKSPRPSPRASDSDVRLIPDAGDMDFPIEFDAEPEAPAPASGGPRSGPRKGADSGARIIPLEDGSDSDVKIEPGTDEETPVGQQPSAKSPSDSDIRLEGAAPPAGRRGE